MTTLLRCYPRIYNQKLFSEIFMHELIHAASYKRLQKMLQLEKKGLLSEADRKALDELRKAFEEAKNKVGDAYAFENLHEFVSETLSNSEFQKALKRESLFSKVINFTKKNILCSVIIIIFYISKKIQGSAVIFSREKH